MGQSIEKPKRNASLRNSHSRSSVRQHQRYSAHSRQQSAKSSHSASKIQQNNQSKISLMTSNYLHLNKNSELPILSCYDQNLKGIKKENQIKGQRISIGGQGSLLSPNFREINEVGAEYGLSNPPSNNNHIKHSLEVSHHRDHHNDTISFSKTKNLINNPFQEESQLKKQSFKKILEESVDHQINNTKSNLNKNQYLHQQIDRISSTKSICSEDRNSKIVAQGDTKTSPNQQNQIRIQKIKQNQTKMVKKQQKNKVKGQQKNEKQLKKMNNTVSYNDYDLNSLSNNNCDQSSANPIQSKKIKLSKKMEELKAKIANKIVNDSKKKESILKGCVRRLSKSLQKIKNDNDISQEKSLQNFRTKNILSKIKDNETKIMNNSISQQIISSKIDNKTHNNDYQFTNNNQGKNKQSDLNKHYKQYKKTGSFQQKLSTYTFQKPAKNQPTKLIIFGGKNTIGYQNVITQNTSKPSNEREKKKTSNSNIKQEQSFTEMVKKQHFSNKNKKSSNNTEVSNQLKLSHAEHNKFSPVTHNFYASTCQQKLANKNQYEFFDQNDQKKRQNVDKLKKQHILSLKQITHQLNNKESKIKNRGTEEMKSFQMFSSSQELSIGNKTFFQKNRSYNHTLNATSLNNTELIGNYEQRMIKDALNRQKQGYQWAKNQRKKHKSLDNTNKFNGFKKGKLLVF